VEDPIEYIFEHSRSLIKQREIGHDTRNFSTALRHVLRQDPDVILVSELRDYETMQAAVTAAETGHLVLSTLHTIDAPKALDRMIDAFPADQQGQIIAQLANCLQAVVSQHLLPHASGKGRVLVSEVMMMTYAITVTACPSLAVPCGLTAGGLPVGMQLIGPPHSEHRLLAAGAWLEQQFGLHERVPLLPQIRL
jgi:Tfp pilus assembly pilus retraction ATPase PilT